MGDVASPAAAQGDRVSDAVVTPVAFADPPLLNAAGVHQPWALRSIVQVRLGGGLVGLGESYGDDTFLALLQRVAPRLVGLSPFDLNGLWTTVSTVVGGIDNPDSHGLTGPSSAQKSQARVFAAFEVAFLDLQGKVTGQPVHALLGGKVRDSVPFSAYLFYKWAGHPGAEPDEWGEAVDPAGIVAQAKKMVGEYGFTSLKLKGGAFPPDEEAAAVQALAEAFPDLPLRIDPNAAWTVPTSQRIAAQLDGVLEYLEDPTPGRVGMAEVAAGASMPLATNMCVVAFADIPEAVRLGSVGIVLSDHHYWGGLRASSHLAAICDTFGWGLSMHSNSHLGISLAAMVQLAAATPNLSYACDTHLPWATDDVVRNPLSFVAGSVPVPDAPGLGVELDPDALARLHEQYLRCGITRRDDATYMRQFRPDFVRPDGNW
ncbi:MAG TPA: enolase C-terminal domain-like protein [Mycobacteriales bacterium]|nr:enolase C-terminal domain-like protein [Mycobacteriales bacterium]